MKLVCEVGSVPAFAGALGNILHHFPTGSETRSDDSLPPLLWPLPMLCFLELQQELSQEHAHVVSTKSSALILSQLFYSRFLDLFFLPEGSALQG